MRLVLQYIASFDRSDLFGLLLIDTLPAICQVRGADIPNGQDAGGDYHERNLDGLH